MEMMAVLFLIILRPLKTHYDVMSCNIIVLQYVEHAVNYDSFAHAHTHTFVLPLSHTKLHKYYFKQNISACFLQM